MARHIMPRRQQGMYYPHHTFVLTTCTVIRDTVKHLTASFISKESSRPTGSSICQGHLAAALIISMRVNTMRCVDPCYPFPCLFHHRLRLAR